MSLKYDEIVKGGLAKQVADAIRTAILEGHLKVDERLPGEEELARRFGVSRPTVREALKRLAAQNLVRSRRGPTGGNFVVRPDLEGVSRTITGAATLLVGLGAFNVDEMIVARMEAEAVCCRMAAVNRSEADIRAMESEIALQRRGDLSDEDFCASDVRFHRALADATANAPLRLMMYMVIESFIPITNMLIYRTRERRGTADAHEQIMHAVEARDGEKAATLTRRHLEGMRDLLTNVLTKRTARK
ncbi:FadR/GntR family transcriptional regulator [Bradyrhizobium sp. USDA 10063]